MDALSSSSIFQEASTTAKYLQSRLPEELRRPEVAIICGSGLGEISKTVAAEPRFEIDYCDVPHFPDSTGKEGAIDSLSTFQNQRHANNPEYFLSKRACRETSFRPSRKGQET